ncbi:MAG TPA: endonuclease domain-containing protein [Patescibacteria group bacterium]|nr:endonuclease domain-containing protein [Patescibacteria group bacterium]
MKDNSRAAPAPSPALAGERRGEGASWATQRRKGTATARRLRKDQTDCEKIIWHLLKDRRFGDYKFRRQHPIGHYVADFACPALKLVIEIDGGQHCENAADESRTAYLREKGYEVLRFWNSDVTTNIEGVISTLTLTLSRKGGRGESADNGPQ